MALPSASRASLTTLARTDPTSVMKAPFFSAGAIVSKTDRIAKTGTATITASAPFTASGIVFATTSAAPISTAFSADSVCRLKATTVSTTPAFFIAHTADVPIRPHPIRARRIVLSFLNPKWFQEPSGRSQVT